MTSITRERAEMGITHNDFRRIFPRLLTTATEMQIGLQSEISWGTTRKLKVEVSAEFVRKIALLRLPYVHIHFEFQGFTDAGADEFMANFDRAFHKGGG